jgi:NitT/TauT family transport system ATP-binding protein
LILDTISITASRGEIIAIIGPSGCGKSTLLNIISGLLRPSEGTILLPQQRLGRMFQSPTLFPWLTVKENIELPLILKKNQKDPQTTSSIIQKMSLEGFEHYYPKELSGGMQSRTALARTLVTNPNLLLLDEPFASLDDLTALKISLELLQHLETNPATVFFVTHNISQAVLLASRIILLSSRPARILADIPIPLAYPRTKATLSNREFHQIVTSLHTLILNESL